MRSLLLSAVLAMSAAAAHSATIDTFTVAQTSAFDASSDLDRKEDKTDTTVQASFASSSSASSGPVSASGSSIVDGDVGTIKTRASVSGSFGDGFGTGSSVAAGTLTETLTLSGSGTLSVSLKLDGNWALTPAVSSSGSSFDPSWFVIAEVNIFGPQRQRDFVCLGNLCGPSLNDANTGSITDHLLNASANFTLTSPQTVDVNFQLVSNISSGNGLLDFGNTAEVLISTTGSLIATPADPDFLSDPAFLSDTPVVPLPATGWLLLSAFGGLLASRRWRQS